MVDYYKILGVSHQATEKEIKAAYRKLAKQYHPDVVKEDEVLRQKMYEIQNAYQMIGDLQKRKVYDESFQQNKCREETLKKEASVIRNTSDMSQFERFFGFQAGKGMETYQDNKQSVKKPEGPMKPEEMFATFFGGNKR